MLIADLLKDSLNNQILNIISEELKKSDQEILLECFKEYNELEMKKNTNGRINCIIDKTAILNVNSQRICPEFDEKQLMDNLEPVFNKCIISDDIDCANGIKRQICTMYRNKMKDRVEAYHVLEEVRNSFNDINTRIEDHFNKLSFSNNKIYEKLINISEEIQQLSTVHIENGHADHMDFFEEEISDQFSRKIRLYNLVAQTLDFIVTRYSGSGNGSKIVELSCLNLVTAKYKDFLLENAHKITSYIYESIIILVKELAEHLDNGEFSNLTYIVNIKSQCNAIIQIINEFIKNDFNPDFDFDKYVNDVILCNRQEITDILEEIAEACMHPVSAYDYMDKIACLMYSNEYIDGIETILRRRIISDNDNELNKLFSESGIVHFK